MTLFDKFNSVIKQPAGAHFFDKYVDYKKKWHDTIMTKSGLIIAKNSGVITKDEYTSAKHVLAKLTIHYENLMDESELALTTMLNREAPLSLIKQINTHTEFDLLEWDIEMDGEVRIKFKPKNVNVSFWLADPKKIKV